MKTTSRIGRVGRDADRALLRMLRPPACLRAPLLRAGRGSAVAFLKNARASVPAASCGDPCKLRRVQGHVVGSRCRAGAADFAAIAVAPGRKRGRLRSSRARAAAIGSGALRRDRSAGGSDALHGGSGKRFCQAHPMMMTASATNKRAPATPVQLWVHPSSTVASRLGGLCAGFARAGR